ncbi:MAG: hypothetical protein M3133_10550 [Actinomycetota bacterium]|nr:hypothetical protein [Actinomycetota bacterium]
MAARVDLLPTEAAERERRRRAVGALVAAGLVFLAVLVGLYFVQLARVNEAEEDLRVAEEERNRLQGEVRELQEYADLDARRERAVNAVKTALATDVSFAGVLQDVAAVMPNDAALTSLSISMRTTPGMQQQPAAEEQRLGEVSGPSFGTISGTGETVRGHAPGVERFLLEFDKIASFFNVFVTSSADDVDVPVTVFNFEADLGAEVFTGRYLEGLPEELR